MGFVASESRGVVEHQGAAAVLMGVGLVSVGVMLVVWAILLLWSPDARPATLPVGRLILKMLGWLSFSALVLACGCFFPLWHVESVSFYGAVALLAGFAVGLRRTAQDRWGGRLFLALIGGAIVAGFFRVQIAVGIVLGIFVFFGGLVHLALLVSPIGRALIDRPTSSSGSPGATADQPRE